jgi:hypothetical protein
MTMLFLLLVPVIAIVAYRLARADKTVSRILSEELGGPLEPVRRPAVVPIPVVVEQSARYVGTPQWTGPQLGRS